MNYLLQIVVLISMVLTVSSSQLTCGRRETDINKTHCSNDSTCPTWFTCNTENNCECDKRQTDAVVCDNDKIMSALLERNCVTYDAKTRSTFAGSCFYNCKDITPAKQHDLFKYLPKKPEMLVNNPVCTNFH